MSYLEKYVWLDKVSVGEKPCTNTGRDDELW